MLKELNQVAPGLPTKVTFLEAKCESSSRSEGIARQARRKGRHLDSLEKALGLRAAEAACWGPNMRQ